eukprot:CAMPEP_0202853766 /NCGR_PEP_ID=MMETSP1389-20130828/90650_1 /ASSEMBLY_ACC=CAM_ASM_000865 /TAXON_ID=302021 /ORGANISM="Rhodomonas sp., Strain CCMP768" /LENGTH=405 /DNA_ID=CAMNT_0049532325 /DNA_START=75 /DNA_END=1292 /DNA_ORIENTATION=+
MIAALLTRPPKHEYDEKDLGPDRFCMDGKLYRRDNIALENDRGHKIQCSHYYEEVQNEEEGFVRVASPCVVYLHSLCGSRLEADEVVEGLLERGLSLFSFDFAGSGKSEGDFVSLGFFETQDLEAVLDFLQDDPMTTSVGFWGRSVGAVVAITVAGKNPFRDKIGGLVLDSPYSSLRAMIDDLAEFYIPKVPLVPFEMVVEATVEALRHDVKKRAAYDLLAIDARAHAPACTCPALFAHSIDDVLVPIIHSKRLVETYGGRTELVELRGDHIAARDPEFLAHAYAFIADSLHAAPPLITEDERAARVSTKKEEAERRRVEREALHDLPCETPERVRRESSARRIVEVEREALHDLPCETPERVRRESSARRIVEGEEHLQWFQDASDNAHKLLSDITSAWPWQSG